jgi:hypothetical protein
MFKKHCTQAPPDGNNATLACRGVGACLCHCEVIPWLSLQGYPLYAWVIGVGKWWMNLFIRTCAFLLWLSVTMYPSAVVWCALVGSLMLHDQSTSPACYPTESSDVHGVLGPSMVVGMCRYMHTCCISDSRLWMVCLSGSCRGCQGVCAHTTTHVAELTYTGAHNQLCLTQCNSALCCGHTLLWGPLSDTSRIAGGQPGCY